MHAPSLKRFGRWFEALLWVALLGFVGYRFAPQAAAALGIGRASEAPAPELAFHTLQGETLSLEELRGQVVLVNFWATWCPPCRLEMPGFERVWREKRDEGLVILGLATDRGGSGEVKRFLAERGISYPVAMAGSEAEARFGGVRALPTSFLIDRQGRVRHRVEGFFAEPVLRQAVNRLLAEPGDRQEGSR